MYHFEIPPSVSIRDDVFGPGTDWLTLVDGDHLDGTAFAVMASQSLRAADALRSVKPTFGFVGDDGQVYTEEEAEGLYEVYTPNFVHDVMHLPGVGANIAVDTKGVLFPDMARTMLRLIVQALAVRGIQATIGSYEPAAWSGAVAYTTPTDEAQIALMRRLSRQHTEHERGVARGMSGAVLTVLRTRGVVVPDAFRMEVERCTDLSVLSTWLRRAVTATTADDVTSNDVES